MSTIYLNQHGTEVSKDGGRILIKTRDGKVQQIPSSYADCFVVMAVVQITHGVIMEILGNGGSIIYLAKDGSIAGELGSKLGRPRNLVRQLACYMDPVKRQHMASMFVKRKLETERNFLSTKYKSHKKQELKAAISKISGLIKIAEPKRAVETLMGIEGIGAKTYFDAFSLLLDGSSFKWNGRKRRPESDPLNAMLNFGYVLLEKDVRRVLAARVLSISIGFIHELDYRKDSLVYDVMEIFRTKVVDRFIFRCIGLGVIRPEDFYMEEGRCIFNEAAKKKFIASYEEYAEAREEDAGVCLIRQIELEVRNIEKELRELTVVNGESSGDEEVA